MSEIVLKIERFPDRGLTTLSLNGQIGLMESEQLRGIFDREISNDRPWVFIEMSNVSFISSSGMSTLLLAVSEARDSGGEVIFIALSDKIKKIFEFLDVIGYIIFTDDIETADEKQVELIESERTDQKPEIEIVSDPIRDMLYDGIRMCDHSEYKNALSLFETILEQKPGDVQALKWKIFTLERLGRFSEAREMSFKLRTN